MRPRAEPGDAQNQRVLLNGSAIIY